MKMLIPAVTLIHIFPELRGLHVLLMKSATAETVKMISAVQRVNAAIREHCVLKRQRVTSPFLPVLKPVLQEIMIMMTTVLQVITVMQEYAWRI
jgi:hypothetical protein